MTRKRRKKKYLPTKFILDFSKEKDFDLLLCDLGASLGILQSHLTALAQEVLKLQIENDRRSAAAKKANETRKRKKQNGDENQKPSVHDAN